jgi:uncharacterized protein
MRRWLNAVPVRWEFVFVVTAAFGYFIVGTIVQLLFPQPNPPLNNDHLIGVVVYESVVLVCLIGFLYLRGWTLRRVGWVLTWRDSGIGILLTIIAMGLHYTVWQIIVAIYPGMVRQITTLVAKDLQLLSILAVSTVNPIFEELFLCGYVITALKEKRGLAFAINVSVALRLSYHLYQGSQGVISAISVGMLFAWWYGKTGRLWPIIVAHACLDFAGLWYASR